MKHSILILDHNKKQEALNCLLSIRELATFDKKIYYLANGNSEDYASEFLKEGLIDVLLVNEENNGCGFGTMQLFQSCDTEYAFYIQCDQFVLHAINQSDADSFVDVLQKNPKLSHIDLAGNQGHGQYSERAQFINVKFYNSIPKLGGGPGPFHHLEWTEETIQKYAKSNDLTFVSVSPTIVADVGKWAVRQNPDGSKWKHRTDTKELWMVSSPKEKYVYPYFNEEEWNQVIETGIWEDGRIPEKEKPHSFKHWK